MSEATLVRRILKELRSKYPEGVFYKIHTGPFQERGVPDILGCIGGTFIGIEVKTPSNSGGLTKYQQFQLNRISRAGGISGKATSVKGALKLISAISK